MPLTIVPVADRYWPAFEDLFGKQGACFGCWCMYFRLSPKERKEHGGERRRSMIHDRIAEGPPPGMLALEGDRAVGWMQIGPRSDVREWNGKRRASAPLVETEAADGRAWAISCFFVRPSERGGGLSHRLVAAGIDFARERGARIVDACPIVHSDDSSGMGLFVGSARVFEKAGFATVARRRPGRPLMRLVLEAQPDQVDRS